MRAGIILKYQSAVIEKWESEIAGINNEAVSTTLHSRPGCYCVSSRCLDSD
jgi:hypothetical protein